MPLEATVNRIPDLNPDWPIDGDLVNEGAAHLRNIKTAVTADNADLVGMVTAWHGILADIPAGWALCDGANGTPDLRDRFVVGAGNNYALDDTGGVDSVVLSLSQIPGHDHGGGGNTGSDGGHNHSASSGGAGGHNHGGSTGSDGGHSHSGNTNTTGSHRHSILDEWDGAGSAAGREQFAHPSETYGSSPTPSYRQNTGDGTNTPFLSAAGNHSHSLSINGVGNHTHTISSVSNHSHSVSVNSVADHTHTYSIPSAGGGGSHENRPPYYGLFWIKKIAA